MGSNRYRQPPKPIDEVVGDLMRRISKLERLPRANYTSVDSSNFVVKNGALRVYNSAGALIVEIGLVTDGRYGVRVLDASGNEVAMITQLGIEAQDNTGTIVPMNVP